MSPMRQFANVKTIGKGRLSVVNNGRNAATWGYQRSNCIQYRDKTIWQVSD